MFFRCNEEKLAMNFMNCSVREKTLTSWTEKNLEICLKLGTSLIRYF
jgi:hypothetical protein